MNLERMKDRFEYLKGNFHTSDQIGFNRLAFSNEEKAAIDWIRHLASKHQLNISKDAVGNCFIRLEGSSDRTIAFGSHLDTVKNGGLYDGALGVLAALECIESWAEEGFKPYKSIELIIFIAEEANPLGGTFGSRVMCGKYDLPNNELLLSSVGLSAEQINNSKTTKNYDAFIELHIEQGNLLEEKEIDIGIVNAIAGIIRTSIKIYGEARHVGTTPINIRKDALVQASSIISFVNQLPSSISDILCTIGELHVKPNLPSVIPGLVEMVVEIRGNQYENMIEAENSLRTYLDNMNYHFDFERTVTKTPNEMDFPLQQIIKDTCNTLGYSSFTMYSGASHDAKSLSNICPSGMIFIPSVNGISHHPDEFSKWTDIEKGSLVLKNVVQKLSLMKEDVLYEYGNA